MSEASDQTEAAVSQETQDASRRTMLAAERTMLAWLRTGVAVGALGVAVGSIVPGLQPEEPHWPYAILGIAYGVLGCAIVAYGLVRARKVETAIAAGDWAPLSSSAFWALGLSTTALVGLSALLIAIA